MNTTFEQYKSLIEEVDFDEMDRITFKNNVFIFVGDFITTERKRNLSVTSRGGRITCNPLNANICVVGSCLKVDGINYNIFIEDLKEILDLKKKYSNILIIREKAFNCFLEKTFR